MRHCPTFPNKKNKSNNNKKNKSYNNKIGHPKNGYL